MAIPVVLDVDPGHDDAVASMLACGSPGLEVRAVTTVAGNVSLEKTTRNALRVLSLIRRRDIPVGVGAAAPLQRALQTAEDVHGESGLEGSEIPEADFEPDELEAVQLMEKVIEDSAEPVTLIPTGPLTNVAAFLKERPDLKERVGRISLMGGSIGAGNTTAAAEFNIYVDPEAARIVFESGVPITMSGLDVTHQATMSTEQLDRVRGFGLLGGTLADLISFFARAYKKTFDFESPPIHDPVAVAAVLNPEVLTTRRMWVGVECAGELTRGETVCDVNGVSGEPPNAEVGVNLDREAFFDLLFAALGNLSGRPG